MTSATVPPPRLLQRLQALAEETRLHLVTMLAGGERCVCELQEDLGGAAQSRLSFHLRKLKEAGLVSDRREGRWVYYTLVPGALEEVRDLVGELATGGAVVASGRRMTAAPTPMAPAPGRIPALAPGKNGGGCCAPTAAGSPSGTGCC